MLNINNDNRVVFTLDAGGTNFVFSAIQGGKEIAGPINFHSNGHDLDLCLTTIIEGFQSLSKCVETAPSAISFAFPGPADYTHGIIGKLENLTAFKNGVPLGPMLENIFHIPVFINNDGDLFTYGEAIGGFLPKTNNWLAEQGVERKFRNLLGFTLGTGFGGGLVSNGNLFLGDNSAAAEVWAVRCKHFENSPSEEAISIRAVKHFYNEFCGKKYDLSPKAIYDIAKGIRAGNIQAAKKAFEKMGEALGDAIANVLTVTDSLVVLGGGLSNAYELFAPAMLEQLNSSYMKLSGETMHRMEIKVYDFESPEGRNEFLDHKPSEIKIPFSDKTIMYDPVKRTGVGLSSIGTSKAVAIGAYAYALQQIDLNYQG